MSDTTRQQLVEQMETAGLVAIIRASSADGLIETCRALRDGGVTVAEITMTTPGASKPLTAPPMNWATVA